MTESAFRTENFHLENFLQRELSQDFHSKNATEPDYFGDFLALNERVTVSGGKFRTISTPFD